LGRHVLRLGSRKGEFSAGDLLVQGIGGVDDRHDALEAKRELVKEVVVVCKSPKKKKKRVLITRLSFAFLSLSLSLSLSLNTSENNTETGQL